MAAGVRLTAAAVISILLCAAILAPWLAPHDPLETHLSELLRGPSFRYPFGTDHLGRCVFSRMLYGARLSLGIAAAVVALAATLGSLAGLTAGYAGGWLDALLMRAADAILAIPALVLSLLIAGLLGPGGFSVILALSMTGWTRYARAVRGVVRATRPRTFVDATRVLGASEVYIAFRRVLPEAAPAILVLGALETGTVILTIASLGFLGLGLQPPAPEWGAMLQGGRYYLRAAPHLILFPGAAILIVVASFQHLAELLRVALHPQRIGFADETVAPHN
jgi:peptide/nickel transport system permease protein